MTPAPAFPARPDAARHDVDVVVLGAGGAGIAAALAAAEAGARVALLEKGNKPGGAAMFGATGFAAYESPAQREAGETFTVRDAFHAITEYARHRCNEKLVRAVLARSGDTVAWLEGHGLRTQLVEHGEAEGTPAAPEAGVLSAHRSARTYHRYVSKFGGFKKLLQAFEAMGGVLLTETAATELVTGPEGQVLGVRAEKTTAGAPLPVSRALSREASEDLASEEGSEPVLVDVAARAVVIATGGYVGNLELVQEDLGAVDAATLHFTGERKATGTGRALARSAGGVADAPRTVDAPALTVPGRYSSKALSLLARLPLLWANDAGERFTDESVVYRFGQRGSVALQQGGHFWMLLDEATVSRLAEEGLDLDPAEDHGTPSPADSHGTPAQPQVVETLEEALDQGSAFIAPSVEELAGATGIPVWSLRETVRSYNQAVEAGEDREFFTPSEILRHPLRQAPFYAVKVVSTVRGTLGGLDIDHRARLRDAAGHPVSGVFAAGNEASGFWGGTYPQIDGLTLCFALNSGRIAGESAAAHVQD